MMPIVRRTRDEIDLSTFDWSKVDQTTDQEIDAMIAEDPDTAPEWTDEELARASTSCRTSRAMTCGRSGSASASASSSLPPASALGRDCPKLRAGPPQALRRRPRPVADHRE